VLYQDTCRFCRGAARLLARLDRKQRMAFLGFLDPTAAPFVAEIPSEDLERSWQVILPSGARVSEGTAVIKALETIDATRWLGRVLRIAHADAAMDALYRFVARTRGRTGRFVRDAPGPRRFP
jgi:predicted DCC family thiol-disulfide oxidoreductase YuxK